MQDDAAPGIPPTLAEMSHAVLLAALCAVVFLGSGLLPGRALLPFPPEALEPKLSEAVAGGVPPAELLRGHYGMGDKFNQSITWDRITQLGLRNDHRVPLWTRKIAGGAPFVPQMAQVYQPWNLLLLVVPSTEIYGLWFALQQILFAALAYRFLRRVGARHVSALFGMVCLAIGLWTQARLHHNVILTSVMPAFWMLSCVHVLFEQRAGARTAGWLALATGLSWLGGLPQASLLLCYVTGAYALAFTVRKGWTRGRAPLLWTLLGMATGGIVGIAQMAPVLLANADSARDAATLAQLTARSLEWTHALTLWWPDLFAWASPAYYQSIEVSRPPFNALLWLDDAHLRAGIYDYAETAFAISVPGAALALSGLASDRRFAAWFFAGVAAAGWLMATATPPLPLLTSVLPGTAAGDLRRFLLLTAVGLPVLATLGMDRWLAGRSIVIPGAVLAAVAIIGSVLWVEHLRAGDAIDDLYAPALAERLAEISGQPASPALERQIRSVMLPGEATANGEHLRATYLRSALAAGLGLLLLLRRGRATAVALSLLALAELAHAGHGTVVAVDSKRLTTPPRILGPALEGGSRSRFQRYDPVDDPRNSTLLRPNLGAFYGLEDLAAYNPLPPRRMEELFNAIEPGMVFGGAGVGPFRRSESLSHRLLDVLGLRWVLAAHALDQPKLVDRTPAGTPGALRLYERTSALPRATLVTRTRVIEARDDRLQAIADGTRDAASEVILEDPGAPQVTAAGAPAAVEITADETEHVEITVATPSAGYLRLADPWDRGWRATIDGGDTPIYVADHYLRAVYVPAGQHRIEFRYDSPWVVWPRRLSLLGLLTIIVLVVAPRSRRATPS